MRAVQLPSGRSTTCLGFGCGGLVGGVSAASSRRLVEIALDAGFRHFDVAPSYGLGTAEDVLGDVLRSCRDEVTIATKVGIGRPRAPTMLSLARTVARPMLRLFPAIRQFLSAQVDATKAHNLFDTDYVRRALAESLRCLQTTRIDLYLMHEIRKGDATAELVTFLLESRAHGILGNIGIGAPKEVATSLSADLPALGRVRQFAWSVLDAAIDLSHDTFVITHGALRAGFKPISEWIDRDRATAQAWSTHLDRDISDGGVLADLLLAASLCENSRGIVLVSSQQSMRIKRFAKVASDCNLLADGQRFRDLVRENLLVTAPEGAIRLVRRRIPQ